MWDSRRRDVWLDDTWDRIDNARDWGSLLRTGKYGRSGLDTLGDSGDGCGLSFCLARSFWFAPRSSVEFFLELGRWMAFLEAARNT